MVFIANPNQEGGVREAGQGEGEGSPDSFPQGAPDTVSPTPTPGLGEDDDDSLLDSGEVDMQAVIVAGGVMEFELLRPNSLSNRTLCVLPPPSPSALHCHSDKTHTLYCVYSTCSCHLLLSSC